MKNHLSLSVQLPTQTLPSVDNPITNIRKPRATIATRASSGRDMLPTSNRRENLTLQVDDHYHPSVAGGPGKVRSLPSPLHVPGYYDCPGVFITLATRLRHRQHLIPEKQETQENRRGSSTRKVLRFNTTWKRLTQNSAPRNRKR